MSGREAAPNRNLAFFSTQQKSLFTGFFRSIGGVAPIGRVFIVASDDKAVAAAKTAALRATKSEVQATSFSALGFLQVPVSFREIAHRITDRMGLAHDGAILAVDMSWGLQTNSAMANFEKWMVVAEDLAESTGLIMASLYNRRLLIDEQLLVALRGHPAVLTSTGIVANPHALPAALLTRGTLREQVDHWLSAISPELDRTPARRRFMRPKAPIRCGCCGARPKSRSRRTWIVASAGKSAASDGCVSIATTEAR